MLELALWLKKQWLSRRSGAGVPAVADGHRHRDVPLRQESAAQISRGSEEVVIPKGIKVRRLHKAFLRYHDPENWPLLREALKRMGRADLIGNGKQHLFPAYQPVRQGAPRRRRAGQTLPHAAHRAAADPRPGAATRAPSRAR